MFGLTVRGVPPEGLTFKSLNGAPLYNNVIFPEMTDVLKESLDKIFNIESCGIQAPVIESKEKEKMEMELIESGLRYDKPNKQWVAAYPWVQDPAILPNNFKSVFGRLKSTEKRLQHDVELSDAYRREVKDMVGRGVARQLTKTEINTYRGPVHYIAHFPVLKPTSASTPVRIVFDPTTKFMGHQLNAFWAKDPNVVSNLFNVLIRFRRDLVGIAGDISKMYHSVKLEQKEQHVHRFLWRDMEVDKPPEHYALTTVTFGDRPSSVLATVAMQFTARMQQSEYPDVVEVVKRDTYVDDLLPNSDSLEGAKTLTMRVDTVLAEGNFRVKEWVMSGEETKEKNEIDMCKDAGQKVLGMRWIPSRDSFIFEVKVNFSPKVRGLRSGKDWGETECREKFPSRLTRRMIVSQVAACFDPLGFLLPYTVRSKLLLRSLIVHGSDVDQNKCDHQGEEEVGEKTCAFHTEYSGKLCVRVQLGPVVQLLVKFYPKLYM